MEDKHQIECCICGTKDQWQNVDEYRLKSEGMCICMKCGFVTYPEVIAKSDDLKEFYREEYREAPTVQGVFTGQRKLHYHNDFLTDLFTEWKNSSKKKPNVFEIGAAFGMFLKWVRDNFPEAKVSGTELTKTHRRIAEHSYGIHLGEEFDDLQKYDLIATYKVAEHIPHIHKELRKYALSLEEDGRLYISVPTWFNMMSNFGLGGFSLDYYYHKNHINVWSRKLFETLLKKCGLEVVKKNYMIYDATYLCKRNDALMAAEPEFENPLEIIDKLDRIKKASLAADDGKFQEAISIFPCFPDAWSNLYESKRVEWHKKGFDAIHEQLLKPAKAACPESHAVSMLCVDLSMRYNNWKLATDYIDAAIKQKPCDPGALIALGACFRQMAEHTTDPAEKIKFYTEAREVTKFLQQVSFEHAHQCDTWIFSDNAKIPMKEEAPADQSKAS